MCIKIPIVFNLLSLITNSVLLIINTMEELLANILPLPLEFTYIEGIMVLALYLSYILIRKGVRVIEVFTYTIVSFDDKGTIHNLP